ncbi:MAG: hypothetical protein KDK89_06895 [Alphaproteobacteria bacterium]|nr:hypothetical protein [Alphaproteobacteria bacterium]
MLTKTLSRPMIYGAFALGVLAVHSAGASAATVNVVCPSNSIQAAIDAATLAEPLILNVAGTCAESVHVPKGMIVTINGVASAVLKPASGQPTALKVEGQAELRNFSVVSNGGSDGALVQIGDLAHVLIEDSTLLSTVANLVVQAYSNSVVVIGNSTVSGGKESAVEISNNSLAYIFASADRTTVIKNAGTTFGQAIGCWQGQLTISSDAPTAKVIIGPSGRAGISARGCQSRIGGFGSGSGVTRFTGAADVAIETKSGDSFYIINTTIAGNAGTALRVTAGVAELDQVTIASNGKGLEANRDATIYFNRIEGSSVVNGPTKYSCYQGGKIFAEAGTIFNGVATNCLKIGGGVTH